MFLKMQETIALTIFLFVAITGTVSFSNALHPNLETQSDSSIAFIKANLTEFARPYAPAFRRWFRDLTGKGVGTALLAQTGPPSILAEFITCEICTLALPIAKILLQFPWLTTELAIDIVTAVCETLHLAPDDSVCRPTIKTYAEPIIYIIRERPSLPNNDFCGVINPGCVPISSELENWAIDLHPNKPAKPNLVVPSNTPLTKIIQLTDTHLDLEYKEGTNPSCNLWPICCRDGVPGPDDSKPGKFGHYSCELPKEALQALVEHARENHGDARYVFLTGDYIHSGVWLYSPEENSRHFKYTMELIREAFKDTAVEIYPLTGNHEPAPVNMYPPESAWKDFPIQWMYGNISQHFTDFIPPDQVDLFNKYGYYTVTPENDEELRLIIINSNICYINNFWLPFDPVDTSGQLKWLEETLFEAEEAGQNVLILGHILPGSGNCWPVWSNQFDRIINRYEGIIRGQFYGHSHEQYYTLTFDRTKYEDEAISVAFVGGSGVTDGMNSGYNIFYLDGERGADSTWLMMNQESFILNLTQSNADLEGKAHFQKILSAQEDFDVTDLSPKSLYSFIRKMVCDDSLFETFQRFLVKGEDSPRWRRCLDKHCRADALSDLFGSNAADRTRQKLFRNYILESDCSVEDDKTTTERTVSDPNETTPRTTSEPEQSTSGSNVLPFTTATVKIAVLLLVLYENFMFRSLYNN